MMEFQNKISKANRAIIIIIRSITLQDKTIEVILYNIMVIGCLNQQMIQEVLLVIQCRMKFQIILTREIYRTVFKNALDAHCQNTIHMVRPINLFLMTNQEINLTDLNISRTPSISLPQNWYHIKIIPILHRA